MTVAAPSARRLPAPRDRVGSSRATLMAYVALSQEIDDRLAAELSLLHRAEGGVCVLEPNRSHSCLNAMGGGERKSVPEGQVLTGSREVVRIVVELRWRSSRVGGQTVTVSRVS